MTAIYRLGPVERLAALRDITREHSGRLVVVRYRGYRGEGIRVLVGELIGVATQEPVVVRGGDVIVIEVPDAKELRFVSASVITSVGPLPGKLTR